MITHLKNFFKKNLFKEDVFQGKLSYTEQIDFIKSYNEDYYNDLIVMGDNPEIPREIIHYVVFKKEKDRAAFIERVELKDFKCLATFYQPNTKYPYKAEIIRWDKTEMKIINQFTFFLIIRALEHNGIYILWETIPINN